MQLQGYILLPVTKAINFHKLYFNLYIFTVGFFDASYIKSNYLCETYFSNPLPVLQKLNHIDIPSVLQITDIPNYPDGSENFAIICFYTGMKHKKAQSK